jgi:hypothetical protein
MTAASEEYLVTARRIDFETGEVTWIEFTSDTIPRPAPGQTVRVVSNAPGEEPIEGDFLVWRLDAQEQSPFAKSNVNQGS